MGEQQYLTVGPLSVRSIMNSLSQRQGGKRLENFNMDWQCQTMQTLEKVLKHVNDICTSHRITTSLCTKKHTIFFRLLWGEKNKLNRCRIISDEHGASQVTGHQILHSQGAKYQFHYFFIYVIISECITNLGRKSPISPMNLEV